MLACLMSFSSCGSDDDPTPDKPGEIVWKKVLSVQVNNAGTLKDILNKTIIEHFEQKVIKGGANIINLRGRSSFQSPAYISIEMIAAAMGGTPFRWPAGTYVSNSQFEHIMMAWETSITADGCQLKKVSGTPEEENALQKSYEHLCALRDEVIGMGVLPPVNEWSKLNPNIR